MYNKVESTKFPLEAAHKCVYTTFGNPQGLLMQIVLLSF